MIRNKALRLVLFNLLLIGLDVTLNVIGVLIIRWYLNTFAPNAGLGAIAIGLVAISLLWIFVAIARGIAGRFLIQETWIPNAIYTIESFVALYLLFNRDSEWILYFIISALFYGAISSGASLITWAIQCKVQKKRAAKQAVNFED